MNKNDKTKKELSKIQKYLLELLKFVNEICLKHNINYSLDCGTLIGAVREKGFIEWDDDADIIFTRNEYEKFISILKNSKLPDFVGVYYPEEKSYFFDFNIRLYYKKERIRFDEDSINLYDGIYSYATLDLFVLDNIPEQKFLKRLYVLKQQIIFGLAMSKRHNVKYKKYGFVEKLAIFILRIFGKFFKIKTLCKLHNNQSKHYLENTSLLYCTSWSPEFPGYQFEKELFNNYVYIKFEDLDLKITKEYDKVLKIEYGNDYMIPRKTHNHDDYSKNL